eukprot:g79951.t1
MERALAPPEGDDASASYSFTLSLRNLFNIGNNTEAPVTITHSVTTDGVLKLSVTFPLSSLANTGQDGWWLYDPDIEVAGPPGSQNGASALTVSLPLIFLTVAASMFLILANKIILRCRRQLAWTMTQVHNGRGLMHNHTHNCGQKAQLHSGQQTKERRSGILERACVTIGKY